MHVICKKTNGNAETHCCVCGQGFVMFWDRQSRADRVAALHELQETLRRQHRNASGPEAHSKTSFTIPEWTGGEVFAGVKEREEPLVPGK